jgi:glycerophosphoryl diester phosphodiesterase
MRIPEIIAHRGAPREAHENTLPAFRLALAQGADGLELDVHATRDGIVVVHHDPVIRRRVSDTILTPIADLDAAELTALVMPGDSRIPTLAEVFEMVGDRATVYVEVKGAGIEAPVIACLDRYPRVRTAVHAFDHRIPVAVRTRRPDTSIGLLSTSYPTSLAAFIGQVTPNAFWQHAHLIDEQLVRNAHALNARLIAWTVNDAAHARDLTRMGVDALCTDTPGLLRAALMAPRGDDPA